MWAQFLPVSVASAGTRSVPPTATTCDNLLRQFDVAWPTHQNASHAARAHKNRELGAAQCQDARYAEGVRNLRRALHDIGVKPVRVVSAPSAGGTH